MCFYIQEFIITMTSRKEPDTLNSIIVTLNNNSIVHSSVYKSLIFQLLINFYYCFLTLVGMNTQNTRIIIYCLLFIINQFAKIVNSLLNSVDPLAIGTTRMIFNLIGWACKLNMVYLLCTLIAIEHPLPVILMIVHFSVANYRLNRPEVAQNHQKGRSFYKVMDFINPILLYSFLKQFDSEQSDLSIIFLIFLCVNLICASELRLILAHYQSDIVGWNEIVRESGRAQLIWNRFYALKLILIISCGTLFLQNISLFFKSLKSEVSLSIIHTLIVGITAYLVSSYHKSYE